MRFGISNVIGHLALVMGGNVSGKLWFFSLLTLFTFLGTFIKG